MTDPVAAAAAVLAAARPWADDEIPVAYLVLGSGLAALRDGLEDPVPVPFSALPGFPRTEVVGHDGAFVWGRLAGRPVLLQAGRLHLYEGHPVETVVGPVRIAARLGARVAILTNAAGGIDRRLAPGDLMLLDDHINLTGRSPLAGPVRQGEVRFPDMSAPYDPDLQARALAAARDLGERLARGVYLGLLGPSFETPAEIRMAERLGAQAVGMSTVLEVIAARAAGLRCLALSMITNAAAGVTGAPLSHAEVLETGRQAGGRLGRILEAVVRGLP